MKILFLFLSILLIIHPAITQSNVSSGSEKEIQLSKDSLEHLSPLEKAKMAFDSSKYDVAIENYQKALTEILPSKDENQKRGEIYLKLARCQLNLSIYEESIKSAERADNLFPKEADGFYPEQYQVLEILQTNHTNLGNFYKAIELNRLALKILKDHPVEKNALIPIDFNYFLCNTLNRTGNDSCIQYCEFVINEIQNGDYSTNSYLENANLVLAHYYTRNAQYEKAAEIYNFIIEFVNNNKPYNYLVTLADTYSNLGALYLTWGLYERGIQPVKKAIQIRDSIDLSTHYFQGNSYYNLGYIFHGIGNYSLSQKYFDQALEIYVKAVGNDHPMVARTFNMQGANFYRKGESSLAILHYEKTIELLKKKKLTQNFGYYYHNIGTAYYDLKEYPKAITYLKKAVEFDQIKPSPGPSLGKHYMALGSAYLSMEEFDSAFFYKDLSLKYLKGLVGEEHPLTMECNTSIAKYYKQTKALQKAKAIYDMVCPQLESYHGQQHPNVGYCYKNLGFIEYELKEKEEAQRSFEKSLQYFTQIDSSVKKSYNGQGAMSSFNGLGDLYSDWYAKEKKEDHLILADSFYQKGLEVFDFFGSKILETKSLSNLLDIHFYVFENAIKSKVALSTHFSEPSDLGEAFRISEKSKYFSLMKSVIESKARKFSDIEEAILEKEMELKERIAFVEKEQYKKEEEKNLNHDSIKTSKAALLFDLKKEQNSLIETLEKKYPAYYNLKYNPKAVVLEDLQKELKPSQMLVEYFVGDSSIFAFLLGKEVFKVKELKKPLLLEKHIQDFRKGLYDYWVANEKSDSLYARLNTLYAENAFWLFEFLIKPLGDLPQNLIIVPDGILGYIPFEALLLEKPRDPNAFKTHAYLGKKHNISYNFSATLWQEMKDKKATGKGVLAIAPNFEHQNDLLAEVNFYRRNNLGPLAHNFTESSNIINLVGGKVLSENEATVEKFLQSASDYSVIHLATHAKLDDENSDYAYLALAGVTDSTNTGKFFIRDLYNLNLPAEMVVLSACETGIGELQKGEGIISLARGFAYAGAKSIITSLWEVNDKSASEIMVDFYENLNNGVSKEVALNNARLSYLDRQVEHRNAHPFFWATFVAIGDMQPISFGGFPRWAVIAGLSLFCVILVFLKRRS